MRVDFVRIDLVGRTQRVVVLRIQVQKSDVTWQMNGRRYVWGRVITPPQLWWVAGVDVAVPHNHSSCPLATETSFYQKT